jgi:hypothetical protein
MDRFLKCFERDSAGVWHCIERASVDLPGGRIEVTPGSAFVRGSKFMNVDVAQLLEDHRLRSN